MTGMVDVIKDDQAWVEFVDEHGPVVAMSEVKRLLRSLGQQEQARIQSLAAAKTDDTIPDAQYEAMKRGLGHWRRSVTPIRQGANKRITQVRTSAVALTDAANADRRMLLILAKRIWLWEEGLEDRLEDALDDCTISNDPEGLSRITLRELIDRLRADGAEIQP